MTLSILNNVNFLRGKRPTEKRNDMLHDVPTATRQRGKSLRTLQEAATLMTNALVEHWHLCKCIQLGRET